MSRLFESFEKLDAVTTYRRMSPQMGLFYAMMSAFFVGAQMVRIIALVHPHRQVGGVVEEVAFLTIWLAFGVLSGRAALDHTSR